MTINIPNKNFFCDEVYYSPSSEIRDEKLYIQVESHKHSQACPSCGKKSSYVHKKKIRKLQDIPIHGMQTFLEVKINQYLCLNPKCSRKYFNEDLPFARKNAFRTIFLDEMILAFAMFMSNEGASQVLKLLGVQVSNDAIGSLYNKLEFKEIDFEEIGIDDVALRRGYSYGTVIYDGPTHQLIALLEGRKAEDVIDWLKGHPQIKRIMRDRGKNYIRAINEALPGCVEVADRFHILQNLIEMLTNVLKEDLPKEICIQNETVLKKNQNRLEKQ